MAQVGHFPTTISDEVGKYQLTVAGYSGDAGDAMAAAQNSDFHANGRMFSTPDVDNDAWHGGHCAGTYGNGGWFRHCSSSDVNKNANGIWTTGSPVWNVQASHMLLRFN